MHTQTAKEPEYHNMAAGDDAAAPEAMDVENAAFQHMFDPPIDVRREDIYKTVARQPMRSKTENKIQKQTGFLGNPNTNRKKKMADEELDDEIEKVSRQEVNDADIEAVRKAMKKSAFNKMAQQELQVVKTDVDSKAKKKVHHKKDDEDELAKVDKQIVSPDEIRDVELAAEKRRHRNFQEGGSSSSSKAKPKAKKRGASKSPETLRYDDPESAHEPKNKLSHID